MQDKIKDIRTAIDSFSERSMDELENFRLKYLSKKGLIADLFEDFRNVLPEQKKELGLIINKLKTDALEKYTELKSQLENSESKSDSKDLSLPSFPPGLWPSLLSFLLWPGLWLASFLLLSYS